MMMVMIVMHVHDMSRWYDDMVVCVNATSIYVSYENNVVQTKKKHGFTSFEQPAVPNRLAADLVAPNSTHMTVPPATL